MNTFIRVISILVATIIAVQRPSVICAQTLPAPAPTMNVVVVDGEAAIHNVRQKKETSIVVLVRDGNREPLPRASVTFTLPSDGASGRFANGGRTLTVQADNDGFATARGLRANDATGPVRIQVEAHHADQTATATVTQFNMLVAPGKGGSGKWIAVLAGIGAAAAGGAVIGLRRGSSAPQTPPPTPIGLTPGSGAVGPPR